MKKYNYKFLENNNTKDIDLFTPEKEKENIQLGLSNMNQALIKLKNPCKDIPAIQIVGTNGKGSITAFLEKILCSSNINIGVTTSPHILDVNERIRVNGNKIEKNEFTKILDEIQDKVKGIKLSPFELIICCSLKYFEIKKVNFLILEAGLGGRLDATTAHKLRPIIALGKIGVDHKEYLGQTIEEITREKVAVIHKDSLVVSCDQDRNVKEIINERVINKGAKMFWVEKLSEKWELGLKGDFQKQNAAVAIKVIKILNRLGISISNKIIRSALKDTKWPGRLDLYYWKNKRILIDCAHNPSAANALAKERENWIYEEKGIYWIIGMQQQKDIYNFIKEIFKEKDKILLVPIQGHQSWSLKEILKISSNKLTCDHIIEFNDLDKAFQYLDKLDNWPLCHPVLTGSIFIIAEFLKNINN